MYSSVKFLSPTVTGGLPTPGPLDAGVGVPTVAPVVVAGVVVFAEDGQTVGAESLSTDILRAASSNSPVRFQLDFSRPINYKELMLDIERQLLSEALARHGGNVTRTAELLNMRRQTLDYKLRKFSLGNAGLNLVDEED